MTQIIFVHSVSQRVKVISQWSRSGAHDGTQDKYCGGGRRRVAEHATADDKALEVMRLLRVMTKLLPHSMRAYGSGADLAVSRQSAST